MKKLVALLLAGVMVFGLAACGNNAPAETPSEPPTTETPADPGEDTTAEAPAWDASRTRGDGVFVVGTPEPQTGTFNPFWAGSVYDNWTANLVHQPLLHFDSDHNRIPVLAADLPTLSEDGLTYTFTLRQDVKFSDGTPFTANDVAHTFNALADPSTVGRNVTILQFLEGFNEMRDAENDAVQTLPGINVIDDYTISFTFTEARTDNISPFLTMGIQSEAHNVALGFEYGNIQPIEDANAEPFGTGPFVLDSWSPDTGSVHTRNPYYWGTFADGAPEMVIIREVNDQMIGAHMDAGDIDYWPMEIMGYNIDELIVNPQFGSNHYTRGGLGYFAFNTVNGATEDVAVRQALMYAFDREAANAAIFESKEVPEGVAIVPATFQNPISPMGPIVRGDVPVPGLNPYDYNMDTAKSTLEDAGWTMGDSGFREKDGEVLTVQIIAMPDHSILDTLVPIWDDQWSQLGVDVQVEFMPFNTIVEIISDNTRVNEWNIFFLATSYTTDLMDGIRGFFHSDNIGPMDGPLSGSNFSRINDPQLDELLDNLSREADIDAGIEIAKQVAVRLGELVPQMPIYTNIRYDFWDNAIVESGLENLTELFSWEYAITQVVLRSN